MAEYPRIVVEGAPAQRGEQYGRLARNRIHRSLRGYAQAFQGIAQLGWEQARAWGADFAPAIERWDARYVEELRGIASGAGVDLLDVLALNIRTEVIFSARVRHGVRVPAECTSVAVTGALAEGGATLIGQNWDYLPHTRETTVVLELRQDDGVRIVTVVEAGLLAKMGMNDAGLALATNGLATTLDAGEPGVPYHVLLRRVLECRSVADAVAAIAAAPRASSGNFMLADPSGAVCDVEAWTGSGTHVGVLEPVDGLLVHTNHCLTAPQDGPGRPFHLTDASAWRYARAAERVRERGGPVSVADFQRAFADHLHHPWGVCTHDDLREPEHERSPTVASLIMEPATRRMLLADGNPCTTPYRALDTRALAPV